MHQTNDNIKFRFSPEIEIVDITDIITNKSRENNNLNVAYLSSELADPNLLSKLPYGVAPNNGKETGTGYKGMVAEYLGGKINRKKKSKSTRKKRTRRRRRHNKTKK